MGSRSPDAPEIRDKRGKKAAPRETTCKVQVGKDEARAGTAAIGDDGLHFHTGRTGRHGKDFALHVRFADITKLTVDTRLGTLTVDANDSPRLVFHLGRMAPEWKTMIEERPSPLAGMGIRTGAKVATVGIGDEEILAALGPESAGEVEVLVVGVEHRADLAQLAALKARVRPAGVIWVLLGGRKPPTEVDVANAGRAAGLIPGDTLEMLNGTLAVMLARG
jgi:hypothetical protein